MTEHKLLPLAVRELPCGSVLYHIRNQSELTRIQGVVRTGSIHEGEYSGCGLSHFLEHMLFQGCGKYPADSASDTIHQLGGDCNAYTTFDHTAYYVELPTEKFAQAADIITSMISDPLFPQEKFQSEKQVIAREADMIFDRPAYVMIQQLWQGLFSSHPARMPIVGFPDKIADVTSDIMAEYYRRRYGAMRTHWLVTGNLNTDMVQAVLSEKLSGYPRGNLDEPTLPEEPEALFETRHVNKFSDPLTRIALGIRAPRASSSITPALDLLAGIIGGSDSSCLTRKFLYQNPLALALDAEFDGMSFGSVLALSAVCEPDNAQQLEQGIRAELALIRKRGVSAEELQKEKLQQRLTLYQQLKNSSQAAAVINGLKVNFNNAECLEHYLERIDKVTLDEVNAAAADYLDSRRFVWSIVEPETVPSSVAVTEKITTGNELYFDKLSNSCAYVLIPRSEVPLESLAAVLPAAPVWEEDWPHGISTLLCKILSTGPDSMPEEEFYDFLDANGIDLDVSCGNNTLSLEMSFPPEARSKAVDMITEILSNPRRDKTIFDRVRKNLIEQLSSKLNETNFVAMLHAKKLIFGNHAGGNSRLESVEELQRITPEILDDFYRSRLSKEWLNLGSTIAPDSETARKEAIEGLEKIANAIPWSREKLNKPQPATGEELKQNTQSEPLRVELDREQSTVICAVAGGFAHKREYYALLILDSALNGLASNLFKEVREKRSLAYSTGIAVNCGLVQGVVALHAGVKPENADETLECLQKEIERLRTRGLEAGEFSSARLAASTALARQLESVDAKLMHAQLAIFYGDDPQNSLKCGSLLRSITLQECNEILSRILSSSPIARVVAGNIKNFNQDKKSDKK